MTVLRVLRDIWPSLVAALMAAMGGFLSMGLLGLVLYHLVSPILNLRFPPLEAWDQPLVWPLIIAMPVVWSPAFVVAGLVNRWATRRGRSRRTRIPLYVAIVWAAALAVWWMLIAGNAPLWTPS